MNKSGGLEASDALAVAKKAAKKAVSLEKEEIAADEEASANGEDVNIPRVDPYLMGWWPCQVMHAETDIASILARHSDPSLPLTASTSSRLSLTPTERALEEKAIIADVEYESDWHRRQGHIIVKPLVLTWRDCNSPQCGCLSEFKNKVFL